MIYVDLFLSFMKIGLLTYGGGYSVIPLITETAVRQKGWLTTLEMTDMIPISEVSPGPFSLNCSTYVGMKMAGPFGSVIASLGFMFPSVVISLILAKLFSKLNKFRSTDNVFSALNACILAVLLQSAVQVFTSSVIPSAGIDWIALTICAICFVVLFKFKVSPILVMIGSCVAGIIIYPVFGF